MERSVKLQKRKLTSDSNSITILSELTGHLGSVYSHALLILTYTSKSKNQVVHEQKFKDPVSGICQISPEMIVLDLESEVHQRPRLYPTRGNFITIIYTILPDLTE